MATTREHADLVKLSVADVMSQPVVSVRMGIILGDALSAMVNMGLRHLAVVDDGDRCMGVVSDRALASAWAANPAALERTRVRDVLDRRPSVVGADANVGDVARAMYTDRVDAVAVIDRAGYPVGLVTASDLVALMATDSRRAAEEEEEEDAGAEAER